MMSLRSLGYVVERYEAERVDELAKLLKECNRKPIEVKMPRDLFTSIEPHLKKSRYLYFILSASDEYIEVSVVAPEALFVLDNDINAKSHKLANPLSIYALLSSSDISSSGAVSTQFDLIRLLVSNKFLNLYVFTSDEYYGRAYLLMDYSKVKGVVYMNSLIYTGVHALRLLFYRLPYWYIAYNVII